MKKIILQIKLLSLLAGILTCCNFSAYSQCSSDVSLNINGQGSAVTVFPGADLRLVYKYSVSNPPACPGCIDQVMTGMGTQYLFCLYSGMPSVCPSTKSGSVEKSIKAPSAPGVYTFYYNTSQDYNCKPQLYNPSKAIGTVTVQEQCPLTVSLNMNEQGNNITAKPGSGVSMQFNYRIANSWCPTCIMQIMFGADNQYLGCIFSDVPALCPSTSSGTYKYQYTAPLVPGTYKIYYNTTADYSCKAQLYSPATLMGTITVPEQIVVPNNPEPVVEIKPEKEQRGEGQTTPGNTNIISATGRYFALIIGVSNYKEEKLNLDRPEEDARALRDILVSRYTFPDSTITMLLSPTREQILEQLFLYRKKVGREDNLLIFYAGHGYFDKEADQGYWWPADAKPRNPANWLSNSDLREQIKSIKSQHTLLISDACFSGGIFKTRDVAQLVDATNDIQQLYKMPSRRAMTSGTLTTVPDKSVFLEYLNKQLTQNTSKYLSSQDLFYKMRSGVIGNSNVVPQTGIIFQAGDEGGDFIFTLRANH